MGAGNFYPHINADYSMVYVHYPDGIGDEDQATEWWYNDLHDLVISLLPESFYGVSKINDYVFTTDNMVVWAENGLLQVCTKECETKRALVVMPVMDSETLLPRFPNLSYAQLPRVFYSVTKGLIDEGYMLYIRTGPWTSGKFELPDTKPLDKGPKTVV